MTILYSLTQTRLNSFLRIVGYRLKLIYRNQARLICLFEISEDLVQGNFWCLYITNAHTPLWISIDIKGDGGFQRLERIQEKFPHFPALWLECRQDSLAQRIDEFVQILRIININIDAMILFTDVFLLKQ